MARTQTNSGSGSGGKVVCQECGKFESHVLLHHIRDAHGLTAVEYSDKHPGAPVFSETGGELIKSRVQDGGLLVAPDRDFELVTVDTVFGTSGESYEVKRFLGDAPWVPAGNDDGFQYDLDALLGLLYALHRETRNSCWIGGYAGTGKTKLVINVCRRLNREVVRINFDSSITRADLIGDWVVRNGQTIFQYGLLPRAMRRGAVLLADEFDCINPYVAALFRPIMEDDPRLVILENGGEVIEPHPDFRVVATANTFGAGDDSGLFGTTQSLSLADRQRFALFIELDYLAPDKEKELLTDAVEDLDDDEAEMMVQVAGKIRESFKEGKLEESISPRQLVNWAEIYSESGNALVAANMAFLLPLTKSSQIAIRQLIEESGLTGRG